MLAPEFLYEGKKTRMPLGTNLKMLMMAFAANFKLEKKDKKNTSKHKEKISQIGVK